MRGDGVFRCAYCGELAGLDRARIFWTWCDTLDEAARDLYAPAGYCSDYCGQQHSRGSVGRS